MISNDSPIYSSKTSKNKKKWKKCRNCGNRSDWYWYNVRIECAAFTHALVFSFHIIVYSSKIYIYTSMTSILLSNTGQINGKTEQTSISIRINKWNQCKYQYFVLKQKVQIVCYLLALKFRKIQLCK